MQRPTRATQKASYTIGHDGAVIGPDGDLVLAPDDPRNPGSLIVDSLGNVVDPSSGAVVLSTLGFVATTTVTRPPTPQPTEQPEDPPPDAEGANGDAAEARLWRALALQSSDAAGVEDPARAPGSDDEGTVDV